MNFYTKNSSSSGFFSATFSLVWLQIFRGMETRALVKVFSGVCEMCLKFYFHTKPFFRSEVPAYASELCLLVTAKYEYDWQSVWLSGMTETCHIIWHETTLNTLSFDRRSLLSFCASSTLQSMMSLVVDFVCSPSRVSARLRFACFCNSPNTTPSGRVGKHNSLSLPVQCTREEGKFLECGRTFRWTTLQ